MLFDIDNVRIIETLEQEKIDDFAYELSTITFHKEMESVNSPVGYTVLIYMQNQEIIKKVGRRNILTSGLLSTYPFISSAIFDEEGIFIGTNIYNNSLVFIDRYNTQKYKNDSSYYDMVNYVEEIYEKKLKNESNSNNRNEFKQMYFECTDVIYDNEYDNMTGRNGNGVGRVKRMVFEQVNVKYSR